MKDTGVAPAGNPSSEGEGGFRLSLFQYELLLAAVCVAGCLICALPLFATGHIPIWTVDGMPLYVNGLIYEGHQLRELARSLFSGNGIALDAFFFNIGFGADESGICTLSDPLTWIAAFVPSRFINELYQFLIYVRVVITAVAFSLYCLYLKRGRRETFVASICYAFGGYALYWAFFRHPFFLDPSYMLPIICLGIERYFREKKPSTFLLALAFSFALNAYFGYMISIAVFAYCLIRYFSFPRERSLFDFLRVSGSFLAVGMIAFALSCVASLPYIEGVAALDRTSVEVAVTPVHQPAYYLEMASYFVGGSRCFIGAVPLVCVVAFLLFGDKFEWSIRRAWFAALAAVAVCLAFPYFAHVFNGFGYATDRWLFIGDFVIANVACLTLPVIWDLKREEKARLARWLLPIIGWAALPLVLHDDRIPIMLGVGTLVLACLIFCSSPRMAGRQRPSLLFSAVTVLFVLCCAEISTFVTFAPKPYGANSSSEFQTSDSLRNFYASDDPFNVIELLPKEECASWRYSLAGNMALRYRNESLNLDRNGMTCYTSLYSQPVCDYRAELGIADHASSNYYFGSDGRLALDAFAGAKYFVAGEKESWRVPATYQDTGLSANDRRLYMTDHALPLGFLYDKAVKREDYDSLSMVEKQELPLRGCVLGDLEIEKSGLDVLETEQVKPNAEEISYSVSCDEGISLEDGTIVVSKPKAAMTLRLEGLNDSETYLCLTNLQRSSALKDIPWGSDFRTLLNSMRSQNFLDFVVEVETALGKRSITPFTKYHYQYCGKSDWAINCGYSERPLHEIRLTFSRAGTYTFDDLTVVCQPIAPIVSELDELREHPLTDIKRGNSKVTARAMTDEDHTVALFTQAYSSGWSAKVDGKPVEVLKGDTGFIAVPIEGAGEHDIELTYLTPGLLPGLAISVLTLIACGAWLLIHNRRA